MASDDIGRNEPVVDGGTAADAGAAESAVDAAAGKERDELEAAAPVDLPPLDDTSNPEDAAKNKDVNLKMILDLPVDVHVELGQASMTIQNIMNFSVGTVLELDRIAGAPVDIVINGKFIGKGEVMVVDENFGVRIVELVDPEKRIESL